MARRLKLGGSLRGIHCGGARRYFSDHIRVGRRRGAVIDRKSFVEQPWMNGLGTTYELDRSPYRSAAPDTVRRKFRWRISQAELTYPGAPFSCVAGADRVLVLLEGSGITLSVAGCSRKNLALHEPVFFPGDVETSSTLQSPRGRNLNIMYDREACSAAVFMLPTANQVAPVPCGVEAVFAVALGTEDTTVTLQDTATSGDNGTEHLTIREFEAVKFVNLSTNHAITGSGPLCVVNFIPSPKFD